MLPAFRALTIRLGVLILSPPNSENIMNMPLQPAMPNSLVALVKQTSKQQKQNRKQNLKLLTERRKIWTQVSVMRLWLGQSFGVDMPRSSSASFPTKRERTSTEKWQVFMRLQTTKVKVFFKQRKLKATYIALYSQPTAHLQADPWWCLTPGLALLQP